MSLLNTDQKREKEHLAMMLTIARDYARAKGFTGTFLIEPKPMEPSKHQYDVDKVRVGGCSVHVTAVAEHIGCTPEVFDAGLLERTS